MCGADATPANTFGSKEADMPQSLRLLLGSFLALIGIIKAWLHSVAVSTLAVPGCFGGDFIVRLDVPLIHRFHCWGCYVVVIGFALMLSAYVNYNRHKKTISAFGWS